jgi:hypothetical protein
MTPLEHHAQYAAWHLARAGSHRAHAIAARADAEAARLCPYLDARDRAADVQRHSQEVSRLELAAMNEMTLHESYTEKARAELGQRKTDPPPPVAP